MAIKKRFNAVDGLDAYNKTVVNVSDPESATDAVNKQTLDSATAAAKNRTNHTGTQDISTVSGLQAALDNKVDAVAGKGLSDENYTSAEKTKLSGLSNYTHPTSGVPAGTYAKVTVDVQGHVTSGTSLASGDIPNLDWSKITSGTPTTLAGYGITDAIPSSQKATANGVASLDGSGKVPTAQLPSFVDDVVEASNFAALPGTGETGKIYVTLDNNKAWRWSGSAYVEISPSPGSTDSVTEGSINLYFTAARAQAAVTSVSGNAGTSTKLATARTIGMTGDGTWSVTFDGSGNVNAALTLANSGVTAGTYAKVTVNAKGLVTSGTTLASGDIPNLDWSKITSGTPTTLAGYGITDALNTSGVLPLTYGDIASSTLTTSTTASNQEADSFPTATYRSAKYVIQVTSSTNYHILEALVIHNGTSAYIVLYGEMFTGASLLTIDADVSGGNCRLLVTPTNAVTVIKTIRQTIKI